MAQQSLPDVNNVLRDGVIGLVGQINPEGLPVGGVLSFIIGLVWAETDTSAKTWESIKEYAEKLVKRAIEDAYFDDLKKRIDGIQSVANDYRREPMGAKVKGHYLTNLVADLDLFEPYFLDERNPERMFPLFTSFATLRIFALAEIALYYKEVYGEEDKNAAGHLEDLRKAIKKYTAAAQALFDRLYSWRFSLLEIKWHDDYVFIGPRDTAWTFTDKYDGFTQSASRNIEAVAAERVALINRDFVEGLQNTLAVARLWTYADPTTPRSIAWEVSSEGPFGGSAGTAFVDKPASGSSRITRIRVQHGALVDCIELFYDGVSAGVHGNPQGGTESVLDLAGDEWVVRVSGRAGDVIDQIQFTTDRERSVGGGGGGGSPFWSGRGRWEEARLVSVSGRSDEHQVTQVGFEWKHRGVHISPYVPSYKNANAVTANRKIHLRAKDGRYVSNLVEEFSGRAAAYEYFPKMGSPPVGLELQVAKSPIGQSLYHGQRVWIVTSEEKAKGYEYLGKFRSDNVYYYAFTPIEGFGSGLVRPDEKVWGEKRQVWELIKMIPTDGPVVFGEHVYLRNLEERNYLCPSDNGYLSAHAEPYAWQVEPG